MLYRVPDEDNSNSDCTLLIRGTRIIDNQDDLEVVKVKGGQSVNYITNQDPQIKQHFNQLTKNMVQPKNSKHLCLVDDQETKLSKTSDLSDLKKMNLPRKIALDSAYPCAVLVRKNLMVMMDKEYLSIVKFPSNLKSQQSLSPLNLIIDDFLFEKGAKGY